MTTLLFAVGSATSYRLHRLFAGFCAECGHHVDWVYDNPPDALFEALSRDARAWGGSAVSLDALVQEGDTPALHWRRMPRPLRAWLCARFVPAAASVHRRVLGARLAAAQKLLQRLSPSVLIVAEDGISGPAALIAAAQMMRIPVAVLPYGNGTAADLDNALDEKAASEPLHRPTGSAGRWLRWLAPEWIKRGRHTGAILFPQEYILARESLGMSLRDAWTVNGGYAQRLMVESAQMQALYHREGLPRDKLLLTGSPYCDVMHEALQNDPQARQAFRQPRTIEPGRLRILVSWPTSYHATRGSHSEFPSYEDMSRNVLGWLQSLPDCTLTVSLHPAVPASARAILASMGLNISDDYVISLIPRHDVYISYFSSTQRWALACGKPVVNYDAYGVNLDVYDGAPGFIGTRRFVDFQEAVRKLTNLADGFAPRAAKQIAMAAEWGVVDGQCSQRILDALQALQH